jgi:hypothetical protein
MESSSFFHPILQYNHTIPVAGLRFDGIILMCQDVVLRRGQV